MNTYGLSSHEYMARQFNFQQGLNLPTNQYLFNGVRAITRPAGQRDTAVYVAPNRLNGARFHSTREFKYWRFNLVNIPTREYTIPPGYVPTTRSQLLQFINAELGLTLEAADIQDAPINLFETPFHVTFQANPSSLLYKGTFSATFTYSLEQLLPIRVLDGFVYPDTQTVQTPAVQVHQHLTQELIKYQTISAEANDELSIYLAHAHDAVLGRHYFDFGAHLKDIQRVTSLLTGYRLTLEIIPSDGAQSVKLFLKESGPDLKGPGWYSAFNDSELPLLDSGVPSTLARGLYSIESNGSPITVKLTAKPYRAIWMPVIDLAVTATLI
jgi:hypothetical protein